MKWIGFAIFAVTTLIYIWNGKDLFSSKEWRALCIKFIAVLTGAFILVFLLVGISKFTPLITKETARALAVIIPASFATLLISKIFIVMLSAIFDTIIRFHERYNTANNYSRLSVLFNKYGPKFLVLAKCLASFGCVLMFYGIWFGSTV